MKRKLIALLLGVCVCAGALTGCDINALLESYLETPAPPPPVTTPSEPTTELVTVAEQPPDTLVIETVSIETAPPVIEEVPVTLPLETQPAGPRPLETSSEEPVFTPAIDRIYPPDLTHGGAEGQYATSYEQFSPVGNIKIEWMPDASEQLNLTDGKMDDWQHLGLFPTVITPDNMVSWGGLNAVPEGWQATACFIADSDYLYVGLYITDPEVVACNPAIPENYALGDCIQISIDYGRRLGWIVENDPEFAELMTNTKYVFYSFAYNGDGGEMAIVVQESDDARTMYSGDEHGMVGTTGKTDDGWCAEFRLPLAQMYHDYCYKAYIEESDGRIHIDRENPLQIGMDMYYLTNEDGTVSGITWTAGTHSGFTGSDENGKMLDPKENPPILRWDVYDNGINLYLPWRSDLTFHPDSGLDMDE